MKWKRVLPSAPWRSVIPNETGLTTEWAKKYVFAQKGSVCPECGHSPLKPLHLLQGVKTSEGKPVTLSKPSEIYVTCEKCDFNENVTDLYVSASQHIEKFANIERSYSLAAISLFILSMGLAYWLGNIFTMIGGALLSLILVAYALQASYRLWQIQNSRLYEKKAPIRDFLRDFFRIKAAN